MATIRNILVPVDFGEPSRHAQRVAIELAQRLGASLTLLHTWEIPSYVHTGVAIPVTDLFHPMRDQAQQRLDGALAEARKVLPETKGILRAGAPWREILAAIGELRPDLVVMGTHGRRGVARALLGSVTEKIIRTSPVPVLTVGAEARSP